MKTFSEFMENTNSIRRVVSDLIYDLQRHVDKAEHLRLTGADWNVLMKALRAPASLSEEEVQALRNLLEKAQNEKVHTKENLQKAVQFIKKYPQAGVQEIMHLLGISEEDAEGVLDYLHGEGYGRTPEQIVKERLEASDASVDELSRELQGHLDKNAIINALTKLYQSGDITSYNHRGKIYYSIS